MKVKFGTALRCIPCVAFITVGLILSSCQDKDLERIQQTAVAEVESLAGTEIAKAISTAVPLGRDAAATRIAELQATALAQGDATFATALAQVRQTVEAVTGSEIVIPLPSGSTAKTATGFFWPTGSDNLGTAAGWMSSSCLNKTDYITNEYHIGKDISADVGAKVYAIAEGKVIWVSPNDWGDGNVALLIEHSLADGTSFTAVYGHIHTKLVVGSPVGAGDEIGTVGPWPYGSHLHFGVRPGTSLTSPYGRMPCPVTGEGTNTNGFVDPINWITTRSPK